MSVPLAVTESAVDVAVPNAEAILGALADAVLVIDGDDCLRYANPAAEQFFGAGLPVRVAQVDAWNGLPRSAGVSPPRPARPEISTRTMMVTRYGAADSNSTGTFAPAVCKLSCNTTIPPKR